MTKRLALNVVRVLVLAAANSYTSQNLANSHSNSIIAADSETANFFEIVTVMDSPDDRLSKIAITRQDIAEILGDRVAAKTTNGWSGMSIERRNIDTWLNKLYRGDVRKEKAFLSGHTVNKTYSLSELDLRVPRDLLTKFFDRSGPEANGWWTMKSTPPVVKLRETDLIATLKEYGFEVARGGDVVPVLLARPKSAP